MWKLPQECSGQPIFDHQKKCQQKVQPETPTAIQQRNCYKVLHHVRQGAGLQINERNKRYYLAWHDFSIDAANIDASIKTGLVVGINYVTAERFICTSRAIVWTLNRNFYLLDIIESVKVEVCDWSFKTNSK